MILGFPVLMYYLWICLVFYDGRVIYPSSLQDIIPFIQRMWVYIRDVSIFDIF
jgi:delta24(24(1))-sterol reductase